MKERCDAQVYFNQDINITPMENYIDKKNEEGIKISILDIVFAAVVRIIAERPQLNRFCINGRKKIQGYINRRGLYSQRFQINIFFLY